MVAMISEYSRRPLRAVMADGLYDMVMGLYYLCAALQAYNNILMGTAVLHTSSMREVTAIIHHFERINLSLFLLPFIAACVVELLKRRFVYPRTGYVSQGGPKDHRRLRLVGAIMVMVLAIALFFGLMAWLMNSKYLDSLSIAAMGNVTVIGIGVMSAISYGILFLRFGFVRHLVIAGTAIITAILLASVHTYFQYHYFFYWLTLGISTIAAGAGAFMKILRIPVATEHDVE